MEKKPKLTAGDTVRILTVGESCDNSPGTVLSVSPSGDSAIVAVDHRPECSWRFEARELEKEN